MSEHDQDKTVSEPIGDTIPQDVRLRAQTIQQRPSETILPAEGSRPDTGGQHAVEALAALTAEASRDITGAVELSETLGEGGMGVVRLGLQRSLGRRVAVKTLKAGVTHDRAVLKLLREAWVTGSLEHPNVAPVYDLGLDDSARPMIVLKRIEGTEWAELMGNAELVRERFGARDLLVWNLAILMQVCNALRFAHTRGIVHRDLKPDNVMIGEFGEVYLLDWGIAVALSDDDSGRLPLARNATEMAGTPHYMAPEMLGSSEPNITPRTDVYLLGAVLHEIVTGQPPHDGDNIMSVIASVAQSRPKLDDDVPPELAGIIQRAMSREPDDRHPDAEAVRLAVQAFLEHRGSAELAAEAQRRLEHLRGYIAASEPGDETQRQRLYNLFSECRFGFREALDAWRGNQAARDGLHRATVAMIEYELAQGDPRGAAALNAQLDEPVPALSERIDEALRDKRRRQEELVALAAVGRQQDPRHGSRTRAFLAASFAIIWTVAPLSSELVPRARLEDWPTAFFWPCLFVVMVLAGGLWARESMFGSAFNRRVGAAVLVALGGQLLMFAGAYLLGIEVAKAQVFPMLLWVLVGAMAALNIDRRIWPVVPGYVVAFVVASAWPRYRFLAMSGCQLILLITAVRMWRVRLPGMHDPDSAIAEPADGRTRPD